MEVAVYFLFSRLKEHLKPYIKVFYRFFHILLTSTITNIANRRELNVRHLGFLLICMLRHNRGHAIFLSRHPPSHFALKIIVCIPLEISRSLKTFKTSTNEYLVSKEYFYMVNPCCNVIFQELSKI
jgi:hypothetical protein